MIVRKSLILEIALYWIANSALTVWLITHLLSDWRDLELVPLISFSYLALIVTTIYLARAAVGPGTMLYKNKLRGDLALLPAAVASAWVFLILTMNSGNTATTIYLGLLITLLSALVFVFTWSHLGTRKTDPA